MPRSREWADRIIKLTQSTVLIATDLIDQEPLIDASPKTAVRLIISLDVQPDSVTSSVAWGQRLDMGIAVVSKPAFDGAVASLPDPRVNIDTPPRGWLWRTSMVVSWENLNALETGPFVWPHDRWDIRAMRKVDRGKLVLITAKTAFRGTETNVNIEGIIRTLVLT